MKKNYNKLTGRYRFKKWNIDTPDSKSIDFFDMQTIKQFTKTGYKTYSFFSQEFIEFDYKHYFFCSLRWFFLRLLIRIKSTKYPKIIKYATKYFIIPVVVIIIAAIIYDLWIKDLIK